jgi:flagellar M-ring protein FliF
MLSRILDQIRAFWVRQTGTQRTVLVTLILVFIVIAGLLINWAVTPTYAVAFSGISEEDAGQIVDLLNQQNISYKLQGNGTILVPNSQVYEVRLSMAREGLPAGGTVGYELFSSNTLGMTEFTQRVNYQRALEGELERTIASLDAVEAVRVHIVTPEQTLLASDQPPTTASVTIQEKASKHLDAGQVRAITFLVANSVEGLAPENVTIVDTNGNLLASGTGDDGIAGGLTQVDNRRSAELSVANDIQDQVKSLLDTALGPNRSVVQVSVALDWTEKQITTQSFNPTPEAIRSEQTSSETYTTNGDTVGGVPGATSNLPSDVTQPTTTPGGTLVYQRTDQTSNYEISSTETNETIHPGEIKQISLSVLVDGVTDQQQLSVIETAISAAAGINRDRGDVISVQSLAFDKTYQTSQISEMATETKNQNIILIAEIAAVVLVAFLLFWYVSRLLRNLKLASIEVWEPVMKPVYQASLPTRPEMPSLSPPMGSSFDQSFPMQEEEKMPAVPDLARIVASKKQAQTPEEEQLQRIVVRMAEDSPATVAEIIQLWLSEDKR